MPIVLGDLQAGSAYSRGKRPSLIQGIGARVIQLQIERTSNINITLANRPGRPAGL